MDVCIFMRDRSGIHCTLEEGHNAEAEDLFDIVLQEQGFPPECEDVFALWLVSPLIGNQWHWFLEITFKSKPLLILVFDIYTCANMNFVEKTVSWVSD